MAENAYARTQDVPVKLVGEDGNVFAIIGSVSKALKRAGFKEEAKSYQEAPRRMIQPRSRCSA